MSTRILSLLALWWVGTASALPAGLVRNPTLVPGALCADPPSDTDGDGVFDVDEDIGQDGDCDNDDTDGDTVADYRDQDDDQDGLPTLVEGAGDTDNDGIAEYLDLDAEDDGIEDATEGDDRDEDGVVDHPPAFADSDQDGLDAAYDPDEGGVPKARQDFDCDGLIDAVDGDDDGDGSGTLGEGGSDTDGDGVPAYLDYLAVDPITLFTAGFENGSTPGWCRVVP